MAYVRPYDPYAISHMVFISSLLFDQTHLGKYLPRFLRILFEIAPKLLRSHIIRSKVVLREILLLPNSSNPTGA